MFIAKLLSIASAPIAKAVVLDESLLDLRSRGRRFEELIEMLSVKNGFYAFEGALHVFPHVESSSQKEELGVEAWNEKGLWRDWYQGLIDGLFFFAEDVFGGQFAISGEEIVSFDPESGEVELLAQSFEGWASELLSNYPNLTGSPIAHSWQMTHGPIPNGKRLLPKIPFALGGQYDEKNLYAVDAVKGMRYRGELWEQLRDLPDGAQVRLRTLPLQ
jgi:hypothetical protein